jgi:Type VI secretion system/phage-baseplate injector OB domain
VNPDTGAIKKLRESAEGPFYGLYRARVEDIDDPDRLERVKVRIWMLHRDEHHTPTRNLPWADVVEHGGGGYDFGPFDPPPVGAGVWVIFEGGDEDFPVVIGTFRGVPRRDDENPNIFLTHAGQPKSEKPWLPPDNESETPKDIFDGVHDGDPHPTRRVWKKSVKGHTLLVEDGDGKEFLKLIDRSGQLLMMDCPVAEEFSAGNKSQRGVRDALRGDQMPHSAMKNRRAAVLLRDLSGQELVLDARENNERVLLKSRNREGTTSQQIEMCSGKGKEKIEIKDSQGTRLVMNPNSSRPFLIEDKTGNAIYFDKEQGRVVINSAKASEESTQQKKSTVKGKSEEEVQGDKQIKVLGNLKTNVVQDIITGVLGNTSLTLGGKVEVVITNQAMDPASQLISNATGLEIQLAQLLGADFKLSNLNGDMEMTTKIGDWLIETLLGDIDLGTAAGNAKLSSLAGNVEASTLAGKATLKSTVGNAEVLAPAGVANVDGSLVRFGSVAAAIQPLIKGTVFSSGTGTLLTALSTALGPITSGAAVPTPPTNSAAIVALATAVLAFANGFNALLGTILSTKVFTE